MKKYLIGGVVVVAFIAYAIFASNNNTEPSGATPPSVPSIKGPTSTTATTTPPTGNPPGAGGHPFTMTTSFGARGPLVSWLQQFLITNKYLTAVSTSTGYFGTATKAALAEFQAVNGITPATGSLDAKTQALINTLSMATSTPTGSAGQYNDGIYTGSVADAFYGKLQVTVTIQGGAITNVTFPQAPSGGHSSDVSAIALPQLAQEAITAQSANVNIVSGATQDSEAFQQSLASALAQAKS